MTEFSFTSVLPITKGWSGDQKYCAQKPDGTKYLLRISPADQYETKKAEFHNMQRVAALGIPMCLPIEFGTCPPYAEAQCVQAEHVVYSLQSWIHGQEAEDIIPTLPAAKARQYGVKAGEMLSRIHTLPAPPKQIDWELRFNNKIDRKIKGYQQCPIQIEGADKLIVYINANRHLLKNRPQCYQHGDYHIGNMMIEQGVLKIIDFNRNDYGDPWEEFNRIVWCAQCSSPFASGMVDGYFGGEPPMQFWRLLALYIACNTLSSIYWAIPFGQVEIDTMCNQAKDVLEWYQQMTNPVPKWYAK